MTKKCLLRKIFKFEDFKGCDEINVFFCKNKYIKNKREFFNLEKCLLKNQFDFEHKNSFGSYVMYFSNSCPTH